MRELKGIAFMGKAGSGKTTLADHCVQKQGFLKLSLAAPVKNVARVKELPEGEWYSVLLSRAIRLFPTEGDAFSRPSTRARRLAALWLTDLYEYNGRELYQHIGTESGRYMDDEMWIKDLFRRIDGYNPEQMIVVDDARFPNEAEALKERGFLVVTLKVPEEDRRDRLEARDGESKVLNSTHPSETQGDLSDSAMCLTNGDLDVTKRAVDQLITMGKTMSNVLTFLLEEAHLQLKDVQ